EASTRSSSFWNTTHGLARWEGASMKPISSKSAVLFAAAAAALLGPSAFAQGDLRSRVQPITSPVPHAGVFHVATGTWTRNGQLSNLTGPDTIYNNTCSPAYF